MAQCNKYKFIVSWRQNFGVLTWTNSLPRSFNAAAIVHNSCDIRSIWMMYSVFFLNKCLWTITNTNIVLQIYNVIFYQILRSSRLFHNGNRNSSILVRCLIIQTNQPFGLFNVPISQSGVTIVVYYSHAWLLTRNLAPWFR